MGIFLHLLLACLLFPAITGLQWVSNDSHTFACTGQNVTLPLGFSADAREEIRTVSWFFEGSTEKKMIATSSRGHFSPLPALSHRVQQVGLGGLMISRVTQEDAGSYTVEVNGIGDVPMLRSVTLHVADTPQTEDGGLYVTLQPEAILDPKTHQWSVVLACGHFVYPQQPSFAVEWITPSFTAVPSSTYTDGWFHLHLVRPLQEGTYVCRVPPSSTCLPANDSVFVGQASIKVERGEMRMMLLEAELASLKQDKLQLQQQLDAVNRSLTQQVNSQVSQLTQQAVDINNILNQQAVDINTLTQQAVDINNTLTQQAVDINNTLTQQAVDINNTLTQQAVDINNTLTEKINTKVVQLTQQAVDINSRLNQQAVDINTLTQQAVDTNTLTKQAVDINNRLNQQAMDINTLTQHAVDINTLTKQAVDINQTLTQRWSDLETIHQRDHASLSRKIQDVATPRVAFNARSPGPQTLSPPAHVQFPSVLYNQGGGFNSATGDFTAPVSGVYVLYFHTLSHPSQWASSFLKVQGRAVCWAYIHKDYDHGSCQAAVHMTAGDRAWVEPYLSNMKYWHSSTSFTGFLLSDDPQ